MNAVEQAVVPAARTDDFRRVLCAASSVAVAGMAVKIIATLKEFVVAGIYGRSDAMDAFLAAFLIPNLLINLFAESMNQALIPTLVRVRVQQGQVQAQSLLSGAMLRLCLLLLAAMIAMAVLAPAVFPLIASNFSGAKLKLAISLFYGLLPVVLLSGLASNCTAVLNTLDRFAAPAVIPALIPLMTIAGALLLHRQLGIWAMVYATLAGALAHVVLAAWLMNSHGFHFALRWKAGTEAAREVARQYVPVVLSFVVASGGLLADQAMAAMLPPGSVSALVYGNRFVSVIITLFAGAISSALTPHFSTLVAQQDWRGCRKSIADWVRITVLISIPVAAILVLFAPWIVRLTLEHGVFTRHDTNAVAPVLAMYALQIPFFAVSRVYFRFILAMRRTDLILYGGLLNLALDIALNLVLMRWMGLAGIALATSLWTAATLIFLWYWSRRLLAEADLKAVEA